MVRSWISIIAATFILVSGAVFEQLFLQNTFENIHNRLEIVYDKLDDNSASYDDIVGVQDYWISCKENLHAFIPHNEIKEIDLWISEAVAYTRDQEYLEARTKIEVVMELCEQIPKGFAIRIENVF